MLLKKWWLLEISSLLTKSNTVSGILTQKCNIHGTADRKLCATDPSSVKLRVLLKFYTPMILNKICIADATWEKTIIIKQLGYIRLTIWKSSVKRFINLIIILNSYTRKYLQKLQFGAWVLFVFKHFTSGKKLKNLK